MYLYHAEALALGGQISGTKTLESQAATSLPMSGGYGTARAVKFQFEGIVSFDAAYTEVHGYQSGPDTYTTEVKTTVEKLNIKDIVKADLVVGGIRSIHTISANRDEASIIPENCSFAGLTIAGTAVKPKIEWNDFSQFATFNDFKKAYDGEHQKDLRKRVLWDQLRPGCPQFLDDMRRWHESQKSLPSTAMCSLVSDPGCGGTSGGIDVYGPILVVPNFGIVYLCEFVLVHRSRRLNMLRVTLGNGPGAFQGAKWTAQSAQTAPSSAIPPVSGGSPSSSSGDVTIGSGTSNGSTFPP
jgi:hypothetical protein